MHKHNHTYSSYLSDLQQAPAKLLMTFLLIACIALQSTHSVAEEKRSAFQNIINKVSRSGSLLMLQAVCDQGKAEIRDGITRCTACPSFASAPTQGSGFELANIVLGSFTQAREPEALLYMKGCESDAAVDGGIVLLQQTTSGWSRLQYQKGAGFNECLKFRTLEDVSNLLCNHST